MVLTRNYAKATGDSPTLSKMDDGEKLQDVPVLKQEMDEDGLNKPLKKTESFLARTAKFAPLPHVLDIRSLALFRILFGLLQLSDIAERLRNGKYDLAWYTSYPPERSYISPDTDYSEEFWLADLFLFRRGSVADEILFFLVYGVCSVFLTVGYKCRSWWLLPLINILYIALTIKVEPGQFGSDQLCVQLLLWMCFLPLSEVWSVDAFLRKRRGIPPDPRYNNNQVKSFACLGFTLQIAIMYMDCFCERTYEAFSWDERHESDWFGQYSLVHYCANGSGTYNTWVTKIIRECAFLNMFMTFCGFWIETLVPPLLLLTNQRHSHLIAPHLMMLHLGIGLILAIPHFYFLGALIHVIWIPTHVWDRMLGKSLEVKIEDEVAHYKKTDGDESFELHDEKPFIGSNSFVDSVSWVATFVMQSVSPLLQLALLFVLVLSFVNLHIMPSKLGQDVTDVAWIYLRFNNEWGMWSPGAARVSPYTVVLGWRKSKDEDDLWEGDSIDLYEFIKTGNEVEFDDFTDDILDNLTYKYPSTRWEKGLGDDWRVYLHKKNPDKDIASTMALAWCNMVNEDMEAIGRERIDLVEIRTHRRKIEPPGSSRRYAETGKEQSRYVYCETDRYR